MYRGNKAAKIKISNMLGPLAKLLTVAPGGIHLITAGTDAQVRLGGVLDVGVFTLPVMCRLCSASCPCAVMCALAGVP